ncbi:MAG: hypothetical protein GX684_06150 [Ruminococcaceae bacterium]|nr:hypothetical protein [Oscillospiraceae bacterium]NLC73336.1 hypothetical protein [Oscillospiraceae bacterium]
MKIKNKRALAAAVIAGLIFIICIIFYIKTSNSRLLISAALLFAIFASNIYLAFSKKGILEELSEKTDERDLFILSKTGYLTVKILNFILIAADYIFIVLYGIYKYPYLIYIAGTLSAVVVLMFITYLGVNIYLEKHE